jgi:hypothetical protein
MQFITTRKSLFNSSGLLTAFGGKQQGGVKAVFLSLSLLVASSLARYVRSRRRAVSARGCEEQVTAHCLRRRAALNSYASF